MLQRGTIAVALLVTRRPKDLWIFPRTESQVGYRSLALPSRRNPNEIIDVVRLTFAIKKLEGPSRDRLQTINVDRKVARHVRGPGCTDNGDGGQIAFAFGKP